MIRFSPNCDLDHMGARHRSHSGRRRRKKSVGPQPRGGCGLRSCCMRNHPCHRTPPDPPLASHFDSRAAQRDLQAVSVVMKSWTAGRVSAARQASAISAGARPLTGLGRRRSADRPRALGARPQRGRPPRLLSFGQGGASRRQHHRPLHGERDPAGRPVEQREAEPPSNARICLDNAGCETYSCAAATSPRPIDRAVGPTVYLRGRVVGRVLSRSRSIGRIATGRHPPPPARTTPAGATPWRAG
jgi:hypothetical protein